MDFLEIVKNIITFFQTNILIAAVAAILLLYLLIRKTKFFLTVFFIVVFLAGLLYLISNLSTTGVSHKKSMIQENIP